MEGGGKGPVRGLPALIGLAIAIAVTALIALSGRFVTTPAKQAVLPATAPSTDIHARENAERQEAQRRDAERIAAERAATDRKAAEERADAERKAAEARAEAERAEAARKSDEAQRAEAARKAEAAQKAEADRREAERRRLEAEQQAEVARRAAAEHERIDAEKRAAQKLAEARRAAAEAQITAAAEAQMKAAAEAQMKAAAEARLQTDAAEADWRASAAGGVAALQAYLQRHPDGAHAAEARAALDGHLHPRSAREKSGAVARARTPRAAQDTAMREKAPPRAANTHPSARPAASKSADRHQRKSAFSARRPKSTLDANGERVIRIARGNRTRIVAAATKPGVAAKTTDDKTTHDETTALVAELFPAEPPPASARYDIPESSFSGMRAYGEATKFILAALEGGGYAERSFFSTEGGGVAMVTRLERIADNGAPSNARWSLKQPPDGAVEKTLAFLRGKFAVEAGRYRATLFMLHDRPAPAIVKTAVGGRSERGTTCAALIYEFVSDGATVRLVENGLSAKEHLAKAGLLKAFEPAR